MTPAAILGLLVTAVVVLGLAAAAALLVARNLVYICGPNEVLVFSGRRRRVDGRLRGYRVIKGGRGFRIPLLETVDRLDLTNMIIEVSVSNAYSKGGIPLSVHGVANVKIAGHEPQLANAIERFTGKSRDEIVRIAKDTLEGNLRGVLAQLTPEEVNEDRIAFAEKLLEEAEHDLSRLGLVLDTLKIQNVSDEVNYLDSIGRKRSAEVVKRARIAEAEARATSAMRDAENERRARLAEIDAEMQVVRAETDRRVQDARTRKDAMIADRVGQVRARLARARADLEVARARVEETRRRLQADVVAPAQAEMEAARAEARGRAARIVEDGKATVAVLREMIATWRQGGEHAREIFLMQKLQPVVERLVSTIGEVHVDRVAMLPEGSDGAAAAVRFVEALRTVLGVELPRVLGVDARAGDGGGAAEG